LTTTPIRKLLNSLTICLLAACAGAPESSVQEGTATSVEQGLGAQTPLHVLVELSTAPTAVEYQTVLNDSSTFASAQAANEAATDAAQAQLNWVRAEQDSFAQSMASAQLPNTKEVYRLQRVFNGIVYATTTEGMARINAMPRVRAVYMLPIHERDNSNAVSFVKASNLWSANVPLTGRDIKIGIVDTGIDYLHAAFGGPGTVAAYTANDPNIVEPGTFPTAKVVGGKDFAGTSYNAANFATSNPLPDADPLDSSGHGTHVAGTAGGLGVLNDGGTYRGTFSASLDLNQFRIGPGSAPEAKLYALKVFGNTGSTALSALAVEWATDPNGDGDFSDHLDVVNLSLGSAHGSPVDPSAIFYTNAVNAGVSVVASAGNSGDTYFVTGAPGATPAVVSVAASTVGYYPGAVRVNSPASFAGVKPAGTPNLNADGGAAFGPTNFNLTGNLALANPPEACPQADGGPGILNPADIAGKIAVISRGTCSFTPKAYEAERAGAVGVLIVNNVSGDPMSMAGAPITVPSADGGVVSGVTIPVRSLALFDGTTIRNIIGDGGTINVTMESSASVLDPARGDTMAGFSSRGPVRLLGQTMLKPDVTAPGFNIVSAGFGTGAGPETLSGTSMASPLTAGVVALLRQSRPSWSPLEIKALLMNTASFPLYDSPTAPRGRISPSRVGAGRIDAVQATQTNVVAYDKAAPERVSVSFATLDVTSTVTENKTIAVLNKGNSAATYTVTIEPVVAPPGITIAAASAQITVAADGGVVDLGLSLTANPAQMTRLRDATVAANQTASVGNVARNWLSEASGYVVLTPGSGSTGSTLRVPYFAAAVPASNLSVPTTFMPTGTTGTGSLTLSGTGIDTRSLAPAPVGVVSLSTPFELAYASPKDGTLQGPLPQNFPSAENDQANLKYVGVTSNLADGRTLANGTMFVAINTWAVWGSPYGAVFEVRLRKQGATSWEYVAFNQDSARLFPTPSFSDVHYTFMRNLATDAGVTSSAPINGSTPNTMFFPTFMSDTMVLAIPLAPLGLTAGSSAIEYQVKASSRLFDLIDQSPVLSFDPASPAFSSQVDTAILAAGALPVRLGAPGQSVAFTYDLNRARATKAGGLLMIHHHNAAGNRAQAVRVTGLSCQSNAECGGQTPVCDTLTGACVGCFNNLDCARGYCDTFGTRTCKAADCRTPGGPVCAKNYSCNVEFGVCEANQALIRVETVPANSACPAGGIQVHTGFDNDRDGRLDTSEYTSSNTVCNGTSQTVTPEPAGANCASGGVRITSQVPAAPLADGGVAPGLFVCNGVKGDSAQVVPEAAGMNCASGGVRITVGMTGTPTYVCNGTNAAVTAEAAGANCAVGGVKVQVGAGMPAYVCNGASGQSAVVTPEQAGSNCASAGVKIQIGSETPVYACNGERGPVGVRGEQGVPGPAGMPGKNGCSVEGGSLSILALALMSLRSRRKRS
jgi:subtilisin family serine protease